MLIETELQCFRNVFMSEKNGKAFFSGEGEKKVEKYEGNTNFSHNQAKLFQYRFMNSCRSVKVNVSLAQLETLWMNLRFLATVCIL